MGNITGWSGEYYRWNCYNNRRNSYRFLELLWGSVPQPPVASLYSIQAAVVSQSAVEQLFSLYDCHGSKTKQTFITERTQEKLMFTKINSVIWFRHLNLSVFYQFNFLSVSFSNSSFTLSFTERIRFYKEQIFFTESFFQQKLRCNTRYRLVRLSKRTEPYHKKRAVPPYRIGDISRIPELSLQVGFLANRRCSLSLSCNDLEVSPI
jgi:hypothetical protein